MRRRACSRLHLVVKAAVQALAAGAAPYAAAAAEERRAIAAAAAEAAAHTAGAGRDAAGAAAARGAAGPLGGLGGLLQRRFSGREREGGVAGASAAGPAPGSPAAGSRRGTGSRDGAGAPATIVCGEGPPSYTGAMLACLQAKGRLPDNKPLWAGLASLAGFGLTEDGHAAAEALGQLKLQVGPCGGALGACRMARIPIGSPCSLTLHGKWWHDAIETGCSRRHRRPTAATTQAWRRPSPRTRSCCWTAGSEASRWGGLPRRGRVAAGLQLDQT